MRKYKILDLFCGVGGLSHGFEKRKNFQIVAANEILPKMAKAYSLNYPNTKMFCKDIADLSKNDLLDLTTEFGGIDIVLGGPPCQAYSTVGRRLLNDPRANLYKEYHRILKEVKPKVFIYENVVGLLSMHNGELFKAILKLFESTGYKLYFKVLNAADYGTPQIRKRVIIVGSTLENPFSFPEGSYGEGKKSPWTLGDAISDLPSLKEGELGLRYRCKPKNRYQVQMRKAEMTSLTEHECGKYNKTLSTLIAKIKEGKSAWDLDPKYHPTSGFGNTYARLWWNKPCTTLTRNFGTPSSSRCIHPKDNRGLTTREGARVQGFPDNYKFFGSRSDKNLQIGNAVPTMVSAALAKAVEEHLKGAFEDNLSISENGPYK